MASKKEVSMTYKVVACLRRIGATATLAFAICIVSATTSHAQSYTFTTIDVPGATNTWAWGINNAGQIVGSYSYGPPDQYGHRAQNVFVLSGGNFSTFGYPGSYYSIGYGINNSGQIAGTCEVEDYGTLGQCQDYYGVVEGWIKTGASYVTVSYPGAISNATDAKGLNDEGQVVGTYELPSGTLSGYLLSGGSYTQVNPFNSAGSEATGINNAGDIAGVYCQGNCALVGFLQSGSNVTTIAVPGALKTYAFGIDNSDNVVGFYNNSASGPYQSFVWHAGHFVLLSDPLGAQGTVATGINDAGQIVGYYEDGSGVFHGFVATACPVVGTFGAQGERPVQCVHPDLN